MFEKSSQTVFSSKSFVEKGYASGNLLMGRLGKYFGLFFIIIMNNLLSFLLDRNLGSLKISFFKLGNHVPDSQS